MTFVFLSVKDAKRLRSTKDMKTLGRSFLRMVLFLSLISVQISSFAFVDSQNGARQDEVLGKNLPKAGLGELAGRAALG